MNKKEKIKLVNELLKRIDAVEERYQLLNNVLDCIEFFGPIWKMQDFAFKLVAEKIGDKDEWLDWWLDHDFCGEARLGKKGKMRKIDTVEKFVQLIEDSNE